MAAKSKIEWTDATCTPIRARNRATGKAGWHCEHVSEGCRNCYSEGINRRLGSGLPFKPGHRPDIELFLDMNILAQPMRWRRPRMVFMCSMTDLFADFVPDEWIDQVFAMMALCPQHTFQVLTKRPARMRSYLTAGRARPVGLAALGLTLAVHARDARSTVGDGVMLVGDMCHLKAWPLPNVWLGVSAEDQARADERIHELRFTPAAIRFVSAEPLLGPVDLTRLSNVGTVASDALRGVRVNPRTGKTIRGDKPLAALDWVIAGHESGRGARDCDIAWVRSLKNQCVAAGVPFFYKQAADRRGRKIPTPELDGRKWIDFPPITA